MIEPEKSRISIIERSKQALNKGEDEDETEINENDILAPFWDEKIPINKVLDRAEATRIKNDVLSKFKERIISRADIIDKRIKKETELVSINSNWNSLIK